MRWIEVAMRSRAKVILASDWQGAAPTGMDPWVARRAQECVRAHAEDWFGTRVDSKSRSAEELALDIVQRVALPRVEPGAQLR